MRIAWLAALQPPYREPMWRALAAAADLEVSVFLREDRGRHMAWRPDPGYRSCLVRSWRAPVPRRLADFLEQPTLLAPGGTRTLLRGADALIIHVWWQPANVWAAVRARMAGIPYILYAESTLDSHLFRGGPIGALRRRIFRSAGAALVPTPGAAAAALAAGTPAHRVVDIVNSVDVDLFDRRVRRLRDGAAAGPPHRFAVVGQLIPRKNVDTLIRAFAALPGDPVLEVAGDGAERGPLTALARDLGVAERVRFLGFLEPAGVLELLASAHTLVLPSTREVYGYTALEAYVAGLQVVVSEVVGVAGSLAGRSGVWVAPPDEDGLRVALAAAAGAWTGWRDGDDLDFASPERAARDILRAVEIARRR